MTDALRAIQEHIAAHRFDAAHSDLQPILAQDADNEEALYLAAVCCRYLRDFDAALEYLASLKRVAPENGRAHQEEAHTYRDMQRPDAALAAYQRACRYNPALVASWREQVRLLRAAGQEASAANAEAQWRYVSALPKALLAVMDLIAQRRWLRAEELCRQFLRKVPHDTDGMRLLASIGAELGALEDADFLLTSALKLAPDDTRLRIDYLQLLRRRQRFAQAHEQAHRLLQTNPENPQFHSLFAIECMHTGDYARALQHFDQVLERVPGDPATLTARGHALKTRGDYDAAVAAYRDALASQPTYGEAYYALANLKVFSFPPEDVGRMQAQLDAGDLVHSDRVYMHFALGKAFEDADEHASAFRHFARGNRLRKQQSRYTAEGMHEELATQAHACDAALFAQHAGSGHPAPDPIFIVGLPRAGSTLLEQILASHSEVDGTLELPNVLSLAQQLRRRCREAGLPEYPHGLAHIPTEEFRAFGEDYLENTRVHRAGAPYFIDKMPNNFRHIGLIRLMLPNARIIDARRHPMACGFSCFQQLFAEGQEFTYDLTDIGRYYSDYVRLMAHWDDVLPGAVLRVHNEDVVADLEGEVRRMLAHCGLPFEQGCVDYHRTERDVRTPSSEQVRQPISGAGIDRWRYYAQWLQPLADSLDEEVRQAYEIS